MVVLSLFDGMSCAQQALHRANIPFSKYYASEIDKHAITVTQANYPNTIQLGSVVDIDVSKLDTINYLFGGSPCQSFSFAGKRKGMATKCETEILTLDQYLQLKTEGFEFEGQSYLFWEYMRILTDIRKSNPNVKFLLENVMMGSKWEKILTQAIGVNPIEINSALVSAQNRRRLYWTNIGLEPSGLFGDLTTTIKQPKDKGILLKDILESKVDTKYFLSEKMIASMTKHAERHAEKGTGFAWKPTFGEVKANCLRANAALCPTDNIIKIDKQGNPKRNQDKASCFTAGGNSVGNSVGNSGGNHSDMDLIIVHNTMPRSGDPKKGGTGHLSRTDGKTYCLDTDNTNAIEVIGCVKFGRTEEAKKQRKQNMAKGIDSTPFSNKKIIGIDTEKMNTITSSVSKDNLVMQLNPSKESNGNQPYQQNRVYDENGITPALLAQMSSGTHAVYTNKSIRRLTPTECERLQTVADGYTAHVSDSQRYRMLGNGWTIDVIAHILSYI